MKWTIAIACSRKLQPCRKKKSDPMESEIYHGLRASAFGLRQERLGGRLSDYFDETVKQPAYFGTSLLQLQCLHFRQKAEAHGNRCLGFDFEYRSSGYAEELAKFTVRKTAFSFGDIAGDGDCCSSYL